MTYAPADLLAVRAYLLSALDLHPGRVAVDLDPDEVGIVGDTAHDGGYHCGADRTTSSDYSRRESARDRAGLSDAASALDLGDFARGDLTLRTLTIRFVDACQRGDPRTADVREVIYTPDGQTVKRYDRLGLRSTGDRSHLTHTHISFFRDSEGRRARPDNILGLLAELIEGDDMSERLEWFADALEFGSDAVRGGPIAGRGMWVVGALKRLEQQAAADAARDAAAKVAIDALASALSAAGGSVDSAVILARMDAIAERESATVESLRALVEDLHRQLAERDRAAAAAWDGTTT